MTADGLRPGQAWAIAPGPTWQARRATGGGWHVIGRTLAEHPDHGPRYASAHRFAWKDFDGAMLMARTYNAAQAGQGEVQP